MSEPDFSPKFWLGLALLVLNQPVGWGGIAFFSYLAIQRGKRFYHLFGILCYILSWGLLALGVWLAGKEGLVYSKKALALLNLSLSWWVVAVGFLALFAASALAFYKMKRRTSPANEKSS